MATLEEKQIEKTDAILDASLRLFTENGFHATPISLIASTANVGTGTIYRYYKNKDDLINKLYKYTKKKLLDFISTGFSEDTPVKDVFYRIWTRVIKFCKKYPNEMLFCEQFSNTPIISEETRIEMTTFFEPLIGLYEMAVQKGVIENIPVEVVWATIHGTTSMMFKMSRTGDLNLSEKTIKQSFEIFWKGIKK
jgi:AcrR family transcriptional regulator